MGFSYQPIASALGPKVNRAQALPFITRLDPKTQEVLETLVLQYYPENLQMTRTVNYVAKEISGGSLPIQEWVNSGAHQLTFSAKFTCDNDFLIRGPENAGRLYRYLREGGVASRNLDLRSVVAFFTALELPTYSQRTSDTGTPITYPPSKVLVSFPNSGLGLAGGINSERAQQLSDSGGLGGSPFGGGSISIGGSATGSPGSSLPHSLQCIMTSCTKTIEATFPSGLPRILNLDLTFVQIGQREGRVDFPNAQGETLSGFSLGDTQVFSYEIKGNRGKGSG